MKKIYDNNGKLVVELNYSEEYYLNYSKHSHGTFVISIIEKGEIEVVFHSCSKQFLYPNQVLVFNPNQVHQTRSKIKNTLGYYNLYIDIEWAKNIQISLFGFIDRFIDTTINLIDDKVMFDDLIKLFKNILLNGSEDESEKLEKILLNIFKEYSNIDKTMELDNILCDKVEKYILENLNDAITLKDIALEVKYSESYITRIFKKKIGLTPHSFLINKRIEKAKNKLMNNDNIDLAQLSNEVGFYDQSHFSKAFKRVYSKAPNKYKNIKFQYTKS